MSVTFPSATTLSLSCTLTFTKSAFWLTEPLGLWLLSNFKWSGPYWFPFVAYIGWSNHHNWPFLMTQSVTSMCFCLPSVLCRNARYSCVSLSLSHRGHTRHLASTCRVFSVHQAKQWHCWVLSGLTQSWHRLPGGSGKSHGLLTQSINTLPFRCQSRGADPQVTHQCNIPTNWIFL